MSKTGIDLFTQLTANVKNVAYKTTTYTVLLTDEYVQGNGTFTATLPVISTMIGTNTSKKVLFFKNMSTAANGYTLTIAAGTGNTIDSRSTWTLKAGEVLVLSATATDTAWKVDYPNPVPAGLRNYVTAVVTTNDTTAVNVFGASGAPFAGDIVSIVSLAQNGTAANILTKNANGTVSTIAKGTTAGAAVSATDLSAPTVAKGDLVTVESSATDGTSRVEIIFSTQNLNYV